MKGSVMAAARWWTNRLDLGTRHSSILQSGNFSAALKSMVNNSLRKYASCNLTTSPSPSGIVQRAAEIAQVPAGKIPHGIKMEIYPDKVIVTHNGGRKETIYED